MSRPRVPLLRGWRRRLQLCACIERRIVSYDRCRRRRWRQARDVRRGRRHDARLVGIEHDLLRPASRGLDADRLLEGRLGGNGLRRWRVWIRRLGLSRPDPVHGEQQHDENAPHISEISKYRHCSCPCPRALIVGQMPPEAIVPRDMHVIVTATGSNASSKGTTDPGCCSQMRQLQP
jgi:hypothetical protein